MPRCDERRHLVGFDLSIDSDCAVPGSLDDRVSAAAAADIRISTLPPFVANEPPEPVYRWQDGTLKFSALGIARYFCRPDAIEVAAQQGADPELVSALLIATALPALMWLRGGAMVHAASVVAPGGQSALAIAGPSGIGKSTLTAQLIGTGGALLADDSICLRRCDDHVEASGLPGGYHLCTGRGDGRAFHSLPSHRSVRSAPLGAVVILARTTGAPMLTRLDPITALERLLANLHRPTVPVILGRRAETLATMAFIASHCAIYEWHRSTAALSMVEREMLAREGLW